MDKATREALLGSIEKWERIVAGTGEDRGASIAHYALNSNYKRLQRDVLLETPETALVHKALHMMIICALISGASIPKE